MIHFSIKDQEQIIYKKNYTCLINIVPQMDHIRIRVEQVYKHILRCVLKQIIEY